MLSVSFFQKILSSNPFFSNFQVLGKGQKNLGSFAPSWEPARSAAGFGPKPSQTLATKSAERYLRNALITEQDLLSSWHIGQLFSSWLRPTAAKRPQTAQDSNASRFRVQPFKTAATKSARTSPTECLKQLLVSSRKNPWRAPARTLPTECPKKQVSSEENPFSNELGKWPWENACRSDIISAVVFNQTPRRAPPLARGRRISSTTNFEPWDLQTKLHFWSKTLSIYFPKQNPYEMPLQVGLVDMGPLSPRPKAQISLSLTWFGWYGAAFDQTQSSKVIISHWAQLRLVDLGLLSTRSRKFRPDPESHYLSLAQLEIMI